MQQMACSLHIMDVRLLRVIIPALQEGVIPDLKEEVAFRAHRDILLNWSRKIVVAAAPLADTVPAARWKLYTQFRPLFITVDDPEKAVELTHRLLHAPQLEEVFDFFREELARLDPDRADDILDTARQDSAPGILPLQSMAEITESFRKYMLYQRRKMHSLLEEAEQGELTEHKLAKAGQRLAWRTCHFLANIYPNWYLPSSSFTYLDHRGDLGWDNVVADPRGMFARFSRRIPGLHDHLPIKLSEHTHTGLCIPPEEVGQALSFLMAGMEHPLPPHPKFGALIPEELQAIQEALLYALLHKAGVWEATGMLDPTRDLYPQIRDEQGEREDYPERFAPHQPASLPAGDGEQLLQQDAETWRAQTTPPITKHGHTPGTEEEPWVLKLLKTKVF